MAYYEVLSGYIDVPYRVIHAKPLSHVVLIEADSIPSEFIAEVDATDLRLQTAFNWWIQCPQDEPKWVNP